MVLQMRQARARRNPGLLRLQTGSLVYHLVSRSIQNLFPTYRADSLLERTSYIVTRQRITKDRRQAKKISAAP